MPVFTFHCPDCSHEFRSLVLAGTREPVLWHCSQCDGERAAVKEDVPPADHPWELAQKKNPNQHGYGCMCCMS